ncbi:MAG TPA: YhjD/YihY/BrkB family envelope integrity protein [Thermoanaerobaculia bacterium]|jgi:membrane protein|nr:YhjD/YihY/BrkB family envelope integrity protein [Thermoanaerobaculia bacterium]
MVEVRDGNAEVTGRVTMVVEREKKRFPLVPEALLRVVVTLREVVVETFRGFNADRGADLAGSLAFTTLLTAVPLLATFSLFLAAFFKEKNDQVLEMVNRILPYHTAKLTESLREFVAESTAISGIGLVILIVASVRLIFIVEATFNAVWGAPKRRAWFQRIAIYSFALFSLALLVGAIGSGAQILRKFSLLETVLVSPFAETFFPFAAEFAVLTLLYHYLPNAYVRWGSAGIAGLVIALLLELLRTVFGKYVAMLSRMNLITGSLSLLMFALISVYLVWVLILLGVELTHVLQTKLGKGARRGRVPAGRAENAIRMLLRLSEGGIHRFRELYHHQESSSVEAEKILECLRDAKIVAGDGVRGFALAEPPEKITVARVVEAISPNLYTITPEENDRVVQVLQPLFDKLDAERRALLNATLADLTK